MSAAQFVEEARKLKGAKWRHRGRKPWAVDCIGLVALAGARSGLGAQDERGYGREPWEDRIRKGCRERWGDPLDPSEAKPGDIAVIQWDQSEPSHMAIIGDHPQGGLTLIHAHNLKGVVEHSLAGNFVAVVMEVYRPWKDCDVA
jgi:cell wall-associated NlpC family hydrolase